MYLHFRKPPYGYAIHWSKSTFSVLIFDPSLAIRIKCSHESAVSSLDAEVIDANVSGLRHDLGQPVVL